MLKRVFIILFFGVSAVAAGQKAEPAKPRILKQWSLSPDFTEEIIVPVDTGHSLFHRTRISDRYSSMNAYPGNYGLPFYQLNFFDRILDPDQFLNSYYYPIMHLPGNAVFLNTQVPYTELDWTFGAPRETSEQTFRVRHSQNINRFFNVGLIYDIIFSLGQYNYQRAEDKTFVLHSSYTGPKYKLYFAAGINNIISYENGGITDKEQLGLLDTRDIEVNLGGLNKAVSKLNNKNLLLIQRYTIGRGSEAADTLPEKKSGFLGLSGTFSHIFILEPTKRTYSDSSPLSGFYDTIIVNSIATFDSLFSRSIKNTLRFDFTTDEARKFRLGVGAGIRNELIRYYQLFPGLKTATGDFDRYHISNNALIGKLYNSIGEKFRWVADGELFFTGYKAGDFVLKGEIAQVFEWKKGTASWIINGGMLSKQPSFWYEQWSSNHFEWHNNLKKELRIDLGTSFKYPARKMDIKFNYAIISNYTDFGTAAQPSQYTGILSVAALFIRKELSAWKFHLNTDLLVQQSTNQNILELPIVNVKTSGFFEHMFLFKSTNGKLYTQLGVDASYHTLYHPYSYMPATGRYFRQNEVSTGNYPFLNLFLNLKLKRTRMFLMLDHANAGLMGLDYFMIPNNPMNIRMFRYGVAWTFYN